MLTIGRRPGQRVHVGDTITVEVQKVYHQTVELKINMPSGQKVLLLPAPPHSDHGQDRGKES